MPSATDVPLRGKYRLTRAQEAVLLAIVDSGGSTADRISRSSVPLLKPDGLTSDAIRKIADKLVKLDLVERSHVSEHRYAWSPTTEGRAEAARRRT